MRPIPGYPEMLVDDTGRVARRGHLLPPQIGTSGYVFYCYRDEGGRGRSLFAHKAVALAFHGPRPSGHQVAHSDGNKTHNTPENVRWATPKENSDDKRRHGTMAIGDRSGRRKHPEKYGRGENHNRAKLTEQQARAIRQSRERTSSLAKQFGVCNSTIEKIRSGLLWAWLT